MLDFAGLIKPINNVYVLVYNNDIADLGYPANPLLAAIGYGRWIIGYFVFYCIGIGKV